jgi:hypothetical protein
MSVDLYIAEPCSFSNHWVSCDVSKMSLALQHLNSSPALPFPSPCLRELEKRLSRACGELLLSGIERLATAFPLLVGTWFRVHPHRFLRLCEMLGSLSPLRQALVLFHGRQHELICLPLDQTPHYQNWHPVLPAEFSLELQIRMKPLPNVRSLAQIEVLRQYCAGRFPDARKGARDKSSSQAVHSN